MRRSTVQRSAAQRSAVVIWYCIRECARVQLFKLCCQGLSRVLMYLRVHERCITHTRHRVCTCAHTRIWPSICLPCGPRGPFVRPQGPKYRPLENEHATSHRCHLCKRHYVKNEQSRGLENRPRWTTGYQKQINTPLKADHPERPTITLGWSLAHPRGILENNSRSGWHRNRGVYLFPRVYKRASAQASIVK